MTNENYVLITGAAGFIGKYLKENLEGKYRIVCLDSFDPQVHSSDAKSKNRDILNFDIARDDFSRLDAYGKPKAIIHLAAKTGTGQSMYELENYYGTNVTGSAKVLDFALKNKSSLTHFLFASSRSIYGEGQYKCDHCGTPSFVGRRSIEDLRAHQFRVRCPNCGSIADSIETSENCSTNSASHYALSKSTIEQAINIALSESGIIHCSLRFQNVYGVGQSLNNPYTGVLGIFASLARKGEKVEVYEQGNIARDFVSVKDVAELLTMSLEKDRLPTSLNVGTGTAQSLLSVANSIVKHYNSQSEIEVSNAFRFGDIATNAADLTNFRAFFDGFRFRKFDDELPVYLDWVAEMGGMDMNKFVNSIAELKAHGIFSE